MKPKLSDLCVSCFNYDLVYLVFWGKTTNDGKKNWTICIFKKIIQIQHNAFSTNKTWTTENNSQWKSRVPPRIENIFMYILTSNTAHPRYLQAHNVSNSTKQFNNRIASEKLKILSNVIRRAILISAPEGTSWGYFCQRHWITSYYF